MNGIMKSDHGYLNININNIWVFMCNIVVTRSAINVRKSTSIKSNANIYLMNTWHNVTELYQFQTLQRLYMHMKHHSSFVQPTLVIYQQRIYVWIYVCYSISQQIHHHVDHNQYQYSL